MSATPGGMDRGEVPHHPGDRDIQPLRHFGRPTTPNIVGVVLIAAALVVAVAVPAAIVPPAAKSAPGSQLLLAFAITAFGAVLAVAVAVWRMWRTRDWAWLVLASVPAIVVIVGGAVLAATKAGTGSE